MTERPPFWLCAHEAGHAVAHFVVNAELAQPESIVISLSVDEAFTRGEMGLVRTRTLARGRDPTNAVTCHLAGYAAENYARYGADFLPTADDFAAHLHLEDILRAHEVVVAMDVADPAAELLRLWRGTHRLVDREWGAIAAIAETLRQRLTLTGAEAEAIWRSSTAAKEAA